MKHLNFLVALALSIFNIAYAEGQPAFPTMSRIVGATLPSADGSRLNPKFETEVLRKYNFDETWNSMVAGAIKVELINVRSRTCGERLGTETEFALAVFAQAKYDSELTAMVKDTDATQKVREYFAYQSIPTPEQYKQLGAIPSNALSRQFVASWIASEYLASSRSTVVELAERFLRTKCES
jgi:hypothetical protein